MGGAARLFKSLRAAQKKSGQHLHMCTYTCGQTVSGCRVLKPSAERLSSSGHRVPIGNLSLPMLELYNWELCSSRQPNDRLCLFWLGHSPSITVQWERVPPFAIRIFWFTHLLVKFSRPLAVKSHREHNTAVTNGVFYTVHKYADKIVGVGTVTTAHERFV